ncbi:MAG: TonB-dependent receptor [Phaeodactylibacter sp.]|nr:TonB-dependent receptor [Phaeodactylibacter sp.]MCB9294822.1 TonB-dependent receptor [Lewinellaceae bacterium]
MKQILLTLIVSCLWAAGLQAQERTVTGTVTSADDGLGIIGANILVKGTSTGTITDFEGRYELKVPGPEAVLVFSYTGMRTEEISVGDQTTIDLVMQSSAELLEEVVVVGYGVQKKRVSTGAISKLSDKNLDGFKVQDVQSALEGQVTGLIVNESSGQPGAGKAILIRGISTNGDNTPLFIVDGLQVNSIDNINPGDVESIDVLKDAASSAIYGARAANGVVIITTKKGVEGVSSITYEGFTSVSNPWKLPEMLSSEDYIALTREKFENGGQASSLETLGFPAAGEQTENTDWMDVIFEPATVQSHRVNISAKNAYISLEYWDQNGVIGNEKSNYKRYAARLNTTKELNWLLSFGQNLYVNRVDNQNIGVNDAFGTVIADAFAYDPLTPVYDETKQYGFAQSKWVQKEYINPLSRLFLANNTGHGDQILGNIYLDVTPFEGFKFRSDFGLDYGWYKFRGFVPDYAFHSAFVNPTNDVFQGYGFFQSYQFENYVNYNKDFGPHSVDVVVGTSYRESTNENAGGSSSSIPDAVKFDENWQFLDSGEDTTDLANGSRSVDYALISYYGRLIYDFEDKYLFTATLRRDGSSNFGSNNRWGVFPSFSVGWVISDELFFNVRAIDFLKLRASWGKNGNDRIAPLSYASTIENVFTYPLGIDQSLFTGAALATPPNPNIKWEESVQLDVGVEVRLFDGRLSAEVDYYRKNTKDLLMNQVIPGYIGATNNPVSNLGEIQNEGIEAGLNYRLSIGDLRITTNLNYTTFTNEVINVAGDAGFLQGYSWPVRNTPITRMTEGFPVGHFVGYVTDGIFQDQAEVFSHINADGDPLQPKAKPGDIRFVDVNRDGVINSDDITNIGSPWPDHIIGFSLSADYKGFDFSAILSAQLGHDIFRAYERSDITFTNYQTFWLDRWTPENPSNEYPRLVSNDPNNNQRPSDFYVEDGSFLRLRNIQIGYNIPARLLEKISLTNLRIYFSANNLITVTNYPGFDPDIGSNGWILDTGIDKGFYPSNRIIGGGIKITM